MKIPVSHGHLEALVREPEGSPRGAAIVCHPHPVHGGTMHTKAVYRAAQGLNDAGLVTLRFNFRGVGTSTGSFDDGIGEQDDARAALGWLESEYPHLPIVLGGFSFGSMVALSVGASDDRAAALLGLGLPVDLDERYDYSFLAEASKPILVMQGEQDEFGSGADVEAALAPLGSHITLIRVPDSDHYFAGGLEELRESVAGYFDAGPGARALLAL
ncbi:MAG: alpha/beta fold hydrolase [Gemmatimonadota bacterium]